MTLQFACEARNIVKSYGDSIALKDVSIEVTEGEFLALVGPSGCGKTTLLKTISGFEDVRSGSIFIGGDDMVGIPPALRPTSMVFQKLALFPHKTVFDNIAFPLKLRKVPADTIHGRVNEMLELMELKSEYLERLPAQLSGGEQQRVALARSIISEPTLLLLDEPLSALDAKLKKVLQAELKRLHRNLGVTFIHVTHDLEEAMMLADRICVMRDGKVLQIGAPADIYYRPCNQFVASFIGDTNFIEIWVSSMSDEDLQYECGYIVEDNHQIGRDRISDQVTVGSVGVMMVRPELIRILDETNKAECQVEAVIDEYFIMGSTVQYRASLQSSKKPIVFEISRSSNLPVQIGDKVSLGWDKRDVFVLPIEDADNVTEH